ncbi:MAG: hypothetical protein UZ07_CHB004000832 [Chlorobi bacterium OLB7]|nr:MAG: hypothetical protein UZ07_CHB004000832 [Chlorobi bacterium OLB7]
MFPNRPADRVNHIAIMDDNIIGNEVVSFIHAKVIHPRVFWLNFFNGGYFIPVNI